jgi:hypothetical protein
MGVLWFELLLAFGKMTAPLAGMKPFNLNEGIDERSLEVRHIPQ